MPTIAPVSRTQLIGEALPDWRRLFAHGAAAGSAVSRCSTRANEVRGVRSQREWANQCRFENRARTQMNIGLANWSMTAAAIERVYRSFEKQSIRSPDAYQLILERRMGLPSDVRRVAPQETGPVLWTDDDWKALGQVAPIQPQAPLIGSPASFENTLKGLAAGIDTFGNFANFVLRYPYFDDDVAQSVSVLQALGACSAYSEEGVVVDSYLEDGHCGVFGDYRSIVGWALMERHIVETLCGVPFAIAFGGLTGDPFRRATVLRAIELCSSPETLHYGYVHGSTVTQTQSREQNIAAFVHDASVSLAAIHHFGWGAAYLAVPLTERERVPATDEIMEVHCMARHCESSAETLAQRIDWSGLEAQAKVLADSGMRWWYRVHEFLVQAGVDTTNALELMVVARRVAPDVFEHIGLQSEETSTFPTDLMELTRRETESIMTAMQSNTVRCDRVRVVVASTDVHWPAKSIIERVLVERGAVVVDGGLAVDPERLVDLAVAENCAAIVVTTHNGWALNFGERLVKECDRRSTLRVSLIMGGVLNEDAGPGANSELPRDVTLELNRLGIVTTNDFSVLVERLSSLAS